MALATPVLRHRILLNFHAESEHIDTDESSDACSRICHRPLERSNSRTYPKLLAFGRYEPHRRSVRALTRRALGRHALPW